MPEQNQQWEHLAELANDMSPARAHQREMGALSDLFDKAGLEEIRDPRGILDMQGKSPLDVVAHFHRVERDKYEVDYKAIENAFDEYVSGENRRIAANLKAIDWWNRCTVRPFAVQCGALTNDTLNP